MAKTITVRNLDENTQRVLRHRAVDHNRSLEAEIRGILDEAARREAPASASQKFLIAASEFREAQRGTDFAFPERIIEPPREVFE